MYYKIINKKSENKKVKKEQIAAFISEGVEIIEINDQSERYLGPISTKFLLYVMIEIFKKKLERSNLTDWKKEYTESNISIAEKWIIDEGSVEIGVIVKVLERKFSYDEEYEMEGLPKISKEILSNIFHFMCYKQKSSGFSVIAFGLARLSDIKEGELVKSHSINEECKKQSILIIELIEKGLHLFC